MLTKLFAVGRETTVLGALPEELELVIVPEVEPVFRATSLYSALCKVYLKRGHDAELLEVWSKYASSLLLACLPLRFSGLKLQTCRGRVGRSRDSRPPVGYVRATHGTAYPRVDPAVGSLVGRKGR